MIDIKIGEEKIKKNQKKQTEPNKLENEYKNYNELKYIREYINFYYEKTLQQLKFNKFLLIVTIILLILNLIPSIIKFITLILLM